jgi:hypothetical protein
VLVLLLELLPVTVGELDDDLLNLAEFELVLVPVVTLEGDKELVALNVGKGFPDLVTVIVPEYELYLIVSDTVGETVEVFDSIEVLVVVGVPVLVLVIILVPEILIVIFGVLVFNTDTVIVGDADGVFEGNPV